MPGQTLPQAPDSPALPVTDVLHGEAVTDPYRWLEAPDSADTLAWVRAQNAYVDEVLCARPETARMRDAFAGVLAAAERYAAPAAAPGRVFALWRGPSRPSAALVRLTGDGGAPVVLFDPALEARQPTAIDWYVPSPSGRYIAFGTSVDGSEDSTLRLYDVDSGRELDERVEHARWSSVAWRHDDSGFFYTRHPAPGSVPEGEEVYHKRVRAHALGTDPARDPELFGAGRPLMESHNLCLSEDDRYLYMFSGDGWRRVTVRRIDLTRRDAPPEVVLDGYDAAFHGVEAGGRLILRTDAGGPHGRIVEVDPARPGEESWRVLVRGGEELVLRDFAHSGRHLAVHALRHVSAAVFVLNLDSGARTEVALPGHGTVTGLERGPDGDFLLMFESFTQAPTLYRLGTDGGLTLVAESTTSELARGLAVGQVFYRSHDGTRCPMYIVERADGAAPGPRPTVLSGYGGFNIVRSSRYSPDLLPWLAAGGVYAQANMRGGGEYGEDWHRSAMEGGRQNSFDDFIAAAEHLIAEGVTTPDCLGIEGRSLGGLLTGVVLTQRPDLVAAVVSGVPLLDMLRYHRFLIGALWIVEYGSPDVPEHFPWLRAYSPYHNVRPGTRYPATYLFAAMDDGRVDALHARKMAALLQAATRDVPEAGPILLRTHFHAGHGAGKPLAAVIDELAEVWGFLAWRLGLMHAEDARARAQDA